MKEFILYFAIASVAGFLLMLIDKKSAIKRNWRIPEKTIISLAIFGGSLGVYLGMYTFKHKTRHKKFAIGIPVIILLQIVLLVKVMLFLKLYY